MDESGEGIVGAQCSQITITTPPPAKTFWAVTINVTFYSDGAGQLIENLTIRHPINKISEGLQLADNGSMPVNVQREQTRGAVEKANWPAAL